MDCAVSHLLPNQPQSMEMMYIGRWHASLQFFGHWSKAPPPGLVQLPVRFGSSQHTTRGEQAFGQHAGEVEEQKGRGGFGRIGMFGHVSGRASLPVAAPIKLEATPKTLNPKP